MTSTIVVGAVVKPSDRHKRDALPEVLPYHCCTSTSTFTSSATPTSTSTNYINHKGCCQMTSTFVVGVIVNPRITTSVMPSRRFYLDIAVRVRPLRPHCHSNEHIHQLHQSLQVLSNDTTIVVGAVVNPRIDTSATPSRRFYHTIAVRAHPLSLHALLHCLLLQSRLCCLVT
eukprot:4199176-Amphidinium_carterae.1